MFNPEMSTVPTNWWTDEVIVTHFLFHDRSSDVAHHAFLRLQPPDGGLPGTEVTPTKSWPDVPRSYILCGDDRTATSAWSRRAAIERLAIDPTENPGSLCPMLSRSRLLADKMVFGL
jgi:hypothetical protein